MARLVALVIVAVVLARINLAVTCARARYKQQRLNSSLHSLLPLLLQLLVPFFM